MKVKITLICDGEACGVEMSEFLHFLNTAFPNVENSLGNIYKEGVAEVVESFTETPINLLAHQIVHDLRFNCEIEDQFGPLGSELYGLAEMAMVDHEIMEATSVVRLFELYYDKTDKTIRIEFFV